MTDSKDVIAQVVGCIIKWVVIGLLVASSVGGIAGFFISRYFG
jgi:hypothetical protein